MKIAALLFLYASSLVSGQYAQDDIDSGEVLADLSKEAYDNAMNRLGDETGTCTRDNVRVRKEWFVGLTLRSLHIDAIMLTLG